VITSPAVAQAVFASTARASYWDPSDTRRDVGPNGQQINPFDEYGGYSAEFYPDKQGPWDILYIQGNRVPAEASVSVVRERIIDVYKSQGTRMVSIVRRGFHPAKITIRLKMWHPVMWGKWCDIKEAAKLSSDQFGVAVQRAEAADPINMSHPALDDARILSLVVLSVSTPEIASDMIGARVVTIQALEFVPPSKEKSVQKIQRTKVATDVPINKALAKGAPTPSNAASSAPPSVTDYNGYAKR
jgi:hypothetical protein